MNELIGNSSWAEELRQAIDQVAAFRSSVLVTGASGTGKELIARALHDRSPRAAEPFVAVDCASIPASLFASTLFGHVKGAFSGADYDALGCFRAADGGTIFLDEIGELSLELQAQLLRVIQQRSVIPVGSHKPIAVNIRIVAATNRDLAAEVHAGRFRQDLYYRLNVVTLTTTPLHARRDDIGPLCDYFLAKFAVDNGLPSKSLSAAALQLLTEFDWPGNVRELQNVLERLVIFTQQAVIGGEAVLRLLDVARDASGCAVNAFAEPVPRDPAHDVAYRTGLPDYGKPDPAGRFSRPGAASPGANRLPTLLESERHLIQAALARAYYNQSAAARLLDVDRKLLARKIRKYQIELPVNQTN